MRSRQINSLVDAIIRRADENRHRVRGRSMEQIRAIKEIMAGTDVVFGVYPTERTAEGFQFMVIKGQAALDAARESGRSPAWDAIPCRSVSEAEALDRVLGDLSEEVWPGARIGPWLRLPPPEAFSKAS